MYTVCALVSKASLSLNKIGVDFLVYRAVVGLFCLFCSVAGRKKSLQSFARFRGKAEKETKNKTTAY